MQKQRQFVLFPALLLLLCSRDGQCQTSPTPTPTSNPLKTHTPSKPSPSPTTTSQSHGQGGGGQSLTWSDNIAQAMENLVGALAKTPSGRNNGSASFSSAAAAALMDLVSRLPGMFQLGQGRGAGAAGSGSSQNGNDVGQVLASLFADPRTHSLPAWIEALLKGNNITTTNTTTNSSQATTAVQQLLLQALSQQQGTGQQLQTLLSSLFNNVPQGLSSLHLTPGSSFQDILSAILSDPSLMSSLSSMGQAVLTNLSSQAGLQNMLMEALKQQFPLDPSSQCAADLLALGQGVQQGSMWALQMLDAMGKIPSGVLEGTTTLFGDYSECMSISYTDQSHNIEGLFCGMAIKAPDALAKMGVSVVGLHLCLPSSCTEYHRMQLVQPTLKSIGSQFYGQYCYRPRDPSGDDRFIGVVITFAMLAALCALGTLYGVYVDHHTDKKQQYSSELPQTSTNSPATVNTYTNQAYVSETSTPDDGPAKNGGHVISVPCNFDGNAGNINGGEKSPPPPPYATSQSAAVSQTPSKPEEGLCSKLLLSFSVLRNGRKVLACNQNPSNIGCLHGIRVLSITWVILGHCFSLLGAAQGNTNASAVLMSHFTYAVFPGAFLAVDTFFLLSGCLTAFLFLRSTKKSGLTWSALILYYVHRIWRLTPLYALVLAYYIGIFPYTKKGPLENLQGMDSESDTQCRKYWYYNILYVNNVVSDKTEKMCLGWSWYLSNDMQFYVIAPIILIPWVLSRNNRAGQAIGHVIAVALIAVHTIASGVISYDNDFSVFKNTGQYMDKLYYVPWCRVGPYAVGLLLGFILHKTPRPYRMPKLAAFLGWAMAWAVGLTVVYVTYDNVKDIMHGTRWDAAQVAAYEAMAKWVWATCVGWLIFACYTGYGGFINSLLSWSAWLPLSRLTYGVYLVHLIVIPTLTGNHKTLMYLDGWSGTEFMIAVTVLSYMASFVFSMLIEAPTLGLEKAVLGKIFKKKA